MSTDAAALKSRLAVLETQLAEQSKRHEQASAILREAGAAILQLQGAIAVVRDLLTPTEVVPAEPEDVAS